MIVLESKVYMPHRTPPHPGNTSRLTSSPAANPHQDQRLHTLPRLISSEPCFKSQTRILGNLLPYHQQYLCFNPGPAPLVRASRRVPRGAYLHKVSLCPRPNPCPRESFCSTKGVWKKSLSCWQCQRQGIQDKHVQGFLF